MKIMQSIMAVIVALAVLACGMDKAQAVTVTNTSTVSTKNTTTLSGTVTTNQVNNYVNVYLYWGTTDGQTTQANWANVTSPDIGLTNGGAYSFTLGGLSGANTYYARPYAVESDGTITSNAFSVNTTSWTLPGYSGPIAGGVTPGSTASNQAVITVTNLNVLGTLSIAGSNSASGFTTNTYLGPGLTTNTIIFKGGVKVQ